MLELPEALTVANQLQQSAKGKRISKVIAAQSPHKFAFFHGDPQGYHDLLAGKIIRNAAGYGGLIEVEADDVRLLVGDGVGLRYHEKIEQRPPKHQLLIEFEDGSSLSASVQMYGGIWCFHEGEFDNPYYKVAKDKPSPLSEKFDADYFERMVSSPEMQKLSTKAFLATEQRIPGLGNGVLQDILWNARIHPKRKITSLSDEERTVLFKAVKSMLGEMTALCGRDTEKDLYGNNGRYKVMMSKNSAGLPCMTCGGYIKKENYMGGSVYYCESCQTV
ncbi:MAG: endonuclease VIII [Clostridia bacterium]|nr:endonuclease VIII [Clostridia bacterium]